MGMPVVTVASGGLPVNDGTAGGKPGIAVTESTFGTAVTKVASGGMGVVYVPANFGLIGGGGSWSPSQLSGLIGWWDASVTASLNLTGSQVNSVADQSGLNQTATWTNVKPTYNATGFNGAKPAIMLGSNSCLQTAATFPMLAGGNTLTAWAVCSLGGSGTVYDARMLSYRAPGYSDFGDPASFFMGAHTSTSAIFWRGAAVVTSSALTANPALHRFIVTSDASGNVTLYSDGITVGTGVKSAAWGTNGQLAIGFNLATSDGTIATSMGECGVATGFSNAATVGQLDSYLKAKWGL